METTDLLKKVRRIEIKTRGISQHIFAGDYHSSFKGKGMAFSEVREYQYGDDIRNIDWNVTARFNHPYVKVFEEERELTVMLLIDVSGSRNFGSGNLLKKNLITEISAVLAFSAIQNNDKIGVILFSDKIEMFIPPKKGRQHILRIIRELIEFKPQNTGTNIAEGLRYFTNIIKKRSVAFLISDFIDQDYEDAIKIASRKHDLIALKIKDEREAEIPDVGLVYMKDSETGKKMWLDTSSKKTREIYRGIYEQRQKTLDEVLRKYGIDTAELDTKSDYIKPLKSLFKKRA
ncbi:MAG: DUF58 domain-containing protein [Bacteroidales bacterium]|nr:DUF58 domain-containing protein [Bacteroidales bacterium]MBN2820148.1 DUF58 domain-containing protein [Bacteroidales bacterium]